MPAGVLALVVTVSVGDVDEDPFGVTDDGEIEHAAFWGAPEQLNATDSLKPPAGVMLNE